MKLLFVFVMGFSAARVASAMDAFEIQVYDDSMDKPGQFSAEAHLNTTASGLRSPSFPGQIAPNHMTRMTLEPAYGMTPYWELGGYLQTALDAVGNAHYAGDKLRSKFMLPRAKGSPWFAGVNVEISYVPTKFESSRWGGELRPIAGWRGKRWLFDVNPILDWSFSGADANAAPAFEPAAKLMFDTKQHCGIGAEYYSDLGPIDHMPRSGRQEHVLYGVLDLIGEPMEWNFGVGRGLSPASNDWTIKTIVGRAF